jgi:hypothetical protein
MKIVVLVILADRVYLHPTYTTDSADCVKDACLYCVTTLTLGFQFTSHKARGLLHE